MKVFKVGLLLLTLLCLTIASDRVGAQQQPSQKEVMQNLTAMTAAMDAIIKHLDAIIEEAQKQKIAAVEARAILKAQLAAIEESEKIKPRGPYTEAPAGLLILGGKGLIDATEKLLDAGIKKVEENNRDIERWLEIQRKERESLEKRIPPKR